MEADWEFEIAPEAPVIDAAWAGFVDLRVAPERVSELAELAGLPPLEGFLVRLNAPGSPVFTAKCDVWNPGEIDPDELDASSESVRKALACYIDLLPANAHSWPTPQMAAEWSRAICASLAELPARQCRIDLVIRRAFLAPTELGFGITCYLTACGSTETDAAGALARALDAFSGAVLP